ncbi:MAG: hypothetical protein WC217_02845 [Candidatus Paceibacterota bacterium]
MAKQHGYGNSVKEALWALCPPEERLKILRHLMTYRAVTETCQFEEDHFGEEISAGTGPKTTAVMLDGLLQKWSTCEFGEIPMTLEPFIFFACWGDGFSLEFLTQNARRFLWLPEPLSNVHGTTRGSFFDDDD